MKTLDQIYQIVEESSHETAFNRGEVEGLYQIVSKLNKDSKVLEIGVQFGRSTSVIAELQKEIGFDFIAVDNWKEEESQIAKKHINAQILKHDWKFTLLSMSSKDAVNFLPKEKFDLIHIDGDHSYEGVKFDCKTWLPRLNPGGYACFDDYGHPGMDQVKQAITEYMERDRTFSIIDIFGNKLGVFQKDE